MPAPEADRPSSRWRSYRDVDAAADPEALGTYMDDLAAIPVVAAAKARSLEVLGLRPGDSCLDVGCGTGPELPRLAALVGPGGRVAGVDRSQVLTAAAWDRLAEAGRAPVPAGPAVELVVADAHRLPFTDAEFDACRADRTLQHLSDPEAALAEMARVTRPGGRVVVTEFRWGLVAPGLDRTVTDPVLRAMAGPGERREWVGHRLVEMFAGAGLGDAGAISTEQTVDSYAELSALLNLGWSIPAAIAAGGVTAGRADAWERSLRSLVAEGQAFAGIVILHVVGVRR